MTNVSTTPSYQQLPIIDLSAAARGPQARALLRAQLHSAAHDVGSFQLVGHGVSQAETAALLDATHRFFALDEADRTALDTVNSPHFRGYTRADGTRDRREQFDIGAERPARVPGPGEPAYWWLQGPNQWPAALPELRTAALAWIDRLGSLAARLLRELLASVGAPAGFYDPVLGERAHPRLKLVRYPGQGGQEAAAHKDHGFLTLLLQDEAGGLQVERADGIFHDVRPVPGAFVVNLGELLEAATDGYLLAAKHRVTGPAGTSERYRLCVPFLHNPRLDARIEPLPFPHAPLAPVTPITPVAPVAEYGRDELRGRMRAHPLVAARHHAESPAPV
ncbi:isopenicillin N synthase family dioxygenase [Streptomyces sp. CWNU-52B]|uniref:isopenicillin N synthase family dioxygenase n=1 Tax=unclassified Streptomyces TaxID=2593676 RepID=UPI0039C414DC